MKNNYPNIIFFKSAGKFKDQIYTFIVIFSFFFFNIENIFLKQESQQRLGQSQLNVFVFVFVCPLLLSQRSTSENS